MNQTLFSKLPEEIVQCIIPYTYSIQSLDLRKDILSFHDGSQTIKKTIPTQLEQNACILFFVHQTHGNSTFLLQDLFQRYYIGNPNYKNTNMSEFLNSCHFMFNFNVLYGLMTHEERTEFYHYCLQEIEDYNELSNGIENLLLEM
jgi:hypothetical protein